MADVHMNNQRDGVVPTRMEFEHKKEIKIAAHEVASSATSETSSDNQLTHDEITDEDHTGDVDIDEEDVEKRLTWIGEGLLDGEGLEAVQQFMNLPAAPEMIEEMHEETNQPPSSVERSGSKLQNFLTKQVGTKPTEKSTPVSIESASSVEEVEEDKRQNKLLDFLATDIGERYLDGLYTEDDSDEDKSTRGEKETEVKETSTSDADKAQNNRLLAFLARERGERVHEVEKSGLENEPLRPEPYRVSISIVTPETAAEALASQEMKSTVEQTKVVNDQAKPVAPSAERNKLVDFVKNVQPPSRPRFVLYNPEDLASSTSSGSENEDASPTSNPKDFRLKKRGQDPNRLRFANPGLDINSGVVRQAVKDHYGREELLDFVAEVDVSKAVKQPAPTPSRHESPPPQRHASPPLQHESPPSLRESPPLREAPLSRRESPPVHHEIAPSRRESPPPRKESPLPSARKHDGRLANFLRKFSSKSKNGSDSGGSQNGSRSNSPDIPVRHSAPVPAQPTPPAQQETGFVSFNPTLQDSGFVPFKPAPFVPRNVESEPTGSSTPLEEKLMSRASFGSSSDTDPSSKRMMMLGSLRQLLEDCEKNDLSDISMVRISILLSTINQIVRDDLKKERPAQSIMRRMSLHVPGPQADQSSTTASWVRSHKEREEYERGHTVTTSDIAHHVPKKTPSPEGRVPSPQLHYVEEPVGDDAMTAFTGFETAQNMVEVIQAFEKLLGSCGISEAAARTPLRVYNHVKSALYSQFSFRQKQLFRLLDAKLSVDVYKRQPCSHKRIFVVGAGPVGLRAAVELALLGGQVVVIDKRKMFNRENILHMWPWVVQDLTSLGAKVFFPQFCHSSAYFHVGTRQLQCILLKVALLLGVKVYPGTTFEGIASPDSIVSERKSYYTVVTKPQIPWQEFTAVLGACGTKDKLSAHAGIKRFVFSRKEAIGLVCYFPNLGTNEEKKVNEFSWTIQFKQRMFAKMRDIGIDLENVVYYRGEYHYIVMTPKRNNLLQQGVLKINYPSVSDLVSVDNIDPGALNDYVSRIINFFEIPQKSEFARVRLFDFSTRTRAAQAANILTSRGKKLYVGLIGDALMEPFWPEGLGTCRGFLGAMDACWMVSQIGKQSDEQILADRELGYRIMQHISGFQREDLQKNVRKYNVDPSSRYTVQYPATITY